VRDKTNITADGELNKIIGGKLNMTTDLQLLRRWSGARVID